MSVPQGRSSELLTQLYGDIAPYRDILRPHLGRIARNYPNPFLEKLFLSLDRRIIAIAPMAFCDRLAADLGEKLDEQDLAPLGLYMLGISTHDDVVDEIPQDRRELAALVYAGNIAANGGARLLLKQNKPNAAGVLLNTVNSNHFYQQYVAQTLWQKKPASFSEYKKGVNHICVFSSIGPLYALALLKRQELRRKIIRYANGYGIALQLLDDLRETEEDKKNGYWSFPIIEGAPYRESFRELFGHIKQAREAIPGNWKLMGDLLDRLEDFARGIQE